MRPDRLGVRAPDSTLAAEEQPEFVLDQPKEF
jgi:hypothetical protein